MAVEKQKKMLIKMLCAAGMCIFCLFSVVTGTVAWFLANSRVQNTADDFPVEVLNNNVSLIEFHKYVDTVVISGTQYYIFDKQKTGSVAIDDGTATQTGTLSMGKYSFEYPHHPVLILLELTSNASASIGAKTDEEYIASDEFGGLPTETNQQTGVETLLPLPLSSVIEFYSFTYSKTTSDPTSVSSRMLTINTTEYYALKTNEFVESGSSSNRSSFVNMNGGEFTGMDDNVSLFNGSTTGLSHLGIVVDYYPDSLAYIYSYYLGNEEVSKGLHFYCDWTMTL